MNSSTGYSPTLKLSGGRDSSVGEADKSESWDSEKLNTIEGPSAR